MKNPNRKNQSRKPQSDLWIDYIGNGLYSLFYRIDHTEARPLSTSKNPKDLIVFAYTTIGEHDDVIDMPDCVRLIVNLYHMENTGGKHETGM